LKIIRNLYHFIFAWLASLFYGAPSKKITVVGVTGTKGKSTVLAMLDSILTADGRRVALLSSVQQKIGGVSEESFYPNTMPGRGAVQKFLKKAVAARDEIALIEVTSEGVKQHREKFIHWDAAVFLNLHPEHIESHGSFENYRNAKLDFFRCLRCSEKREKIFVVNADDPQAVYFEKVAKSVPHSHLFEARAAEVKNLAAALKKEKQSSWLLADFNIENIAVAAKTASALGASERSIKEGLENFPGLRGRMDFVQREPFAVVVDYAHTPESLEAVYKTLRKQVKKGGRLICVLGSAGGGRDKWKRPALGTVAGSYCERIILTSEDPYDENPADIMDQIETGFLRNPNSLPVLPRQAGRAGKFQISENYWKIIDRKEALKKAISLAKPGDVVVSTGMGSQKWFYGPKGSKILWDEPKIVEEILNSN